MSKLRSIFREILVAFSENINFKDYAVSPTKVEPSLKVSFYHHVSLQKFKILRSYWSTFKS